MSKKLQEKQRRRLAEQARKAQQQKAQRRSNLITLGIALLVGAVVVFLILQQTGGGSDETVPAGVAASEAGCTDVETFESEGRGHVETGADVDYGTNPPTSGDHYEVTADPGFYTSPLPEEQVVHNLEHGQIVVWYSPDAPDAVKDDLEAYVEAADDPPGTGPLVAIPYDGLEGDATYAMSAWGANQSCAEYSKAAIDDFRARFQGEGPERLTPPFEG